MNRLNRAIAFRKIIDANLMATRRMIRVDELTPAELEGFIDLYPEYNPNSYPYVAGELFKYSGKLYKVINTHNSQLDWIPSDLLAVYDPITPPGTIAPWEQRYGHNPYLPGDKVIWEGQTYECIASTTYSPADAPTAWAIEGQVPTDPIDPNATPEWVQPGGEITPYALNDKVTYLGSTWISTSDNNVWKPGEYGWKIFVGDETPVDPPVDPIPEVPTGPAQWKQPTGGHDAYKVGDKVSHEGAVWTSTADGNTWAPGVYGWTKD